MNLILIACLSAAWLGDREYEPRQYCVTGGADWSEDGVPDLIVGINGREMGRGGTEGWGSVVRDAGRVRVLSGKDGATLRTLHGERHGDLFGSAVLVTQDWDSDGVSDLWIGAPGTRRPAPDAVGHEEQAGSLRLVSGKHGTTLRTLAWTKPCDDAGAELLALDDLDGDGFEDLCIGSQSTTHLFAASSRTGEVLWSLPTGSWVQANHVARIDDQDGDRVGDIVVGVTWSDVVEGHYTGRLLIVSGRSGLVLRVISGCDVLPRGWAFTGELAAARDTDGLPRVIARIRQWPPKERAGIALVALRTSVVQGPLLLHCADGAPVRGFDQIGSLGTSIAPLSDSDGDGVEDFAVSAPYWTQRLNDAPRGAVFFVSGKSLALREPVLGREKRPSSCFADEIRSAGDVDGDGVPDIACLTWRCEDRSLDSASRTIQVVSGRPLTRVWIADLERED